MDHVRGERGGKDRGGGEEALTGLDHVREGREEARAGVDHVRERREEAEGSEGEGEG